MSSLLYFLIISHLPCMEFYPRDVSSHLTLYNRANKSESTYWATYRAPDPNISTVHFGERYEFTRCVRGIFLGYDELDFVRKSRVWTAEKETCCLFFGFNGSFPLKSLRPIGDPNNFTRTSLTLYENEHNEGLEEIYFANVPFLNSTLNYFKSLALTGSTAVTLFKRENFTGWSKCIQPFKYTLVSLIWDIERVLGVKPEDVKSFKFGCFK